MTHSGAYVPDLQRVTSGAGNGRSGNGTVVVDPLYPRSIGGLEIMIGWTDSGTLVITNNGGGAWTPFTGSPFAGPGTEKLYLWRRVRASGDSSATLTVSGSSGAGNSAFGTAVQLRPGSFDSSNPINAIGTANAGTGSSISNDGVITTVDDALLIGIAGLGEADNGSVPGFGSWTFGSDADDVVERFNGATIQGDDSELGVCQKVQVLAGDSGDMATTNSLVSGPWISLTIAINPAPTDSPYRFIGLHRANIVDQTTQIINVDRPVAAGESVVVCAGRYINACSSIVDSKGNSYTILYDNSNGGSGRCVIAASEVSTPLVPGDTITITYAASDARSGGAFAIAVDRGIIESRILSNGNNHTGSTAWATGALSVSHATLVGTAPQHNSGGTGTQVITLTKGIPVGERCVVTAGYGPGGVSLSTITDSKGNTPYTIHKHANGQRRTLIASTVLTTALVAGDTITLTYSGNGVSTGMATAVRVPATGTVTLGSDGNSTGTAWSTGSVDPSNKAILVAQANLWGAGTSSGSPAGWDEIHENSSSNTSDVVLIKRSDGSSEVVSGTWSRSDGWTAVVVAFEFDTDEDEDQEFIILALSDSAGVPAGIVDVAGWSTVHADLNGSNNQMGAFVKDWTAPSGPGLYSVSGAWSAVGTGHSVIMAIPLEPLETGPTNRFMALA